MIPRAIAPQAPSERNALLRRCAAAAAVIGGAAWTVKAGVTLATGDEPALAYDLGSALFPFALLGLWSMVRSVDGRAARIGGWLSAAAALSVVLGLLVRAVGGSAVAVSEDEVTVLAPFIVIAGLGTIAALIALGVAVRRTGAVAPGYSSLPLAMGLATIPLLMIGGALETVSERLLELPIALLGLGWVALGIALWNVVEQPAPVTSREAA